MSKLSQLPLRERIRIWGGPDILTEAGNAIEVLEEEIERLTAEVQRKAEEIETWQTRSIELARSLIKITEHKPSSDCFFCGSGPGCDHGDDCPLHIAESALIDSGLDTFDSGSQKPRIIEREAKMSGVWFDTTLAPTKVEVTWNAGRAVTRGMRVNTLILP